MWILYTVAVVLLLLHWGSRNAVWGTATLGLLVGLIVGFFGSQYWWTVTTVVSIAVLIGAIIEWVPRLLNRRRQI